MANRESNIFFKTSPRKLERSYRTEVKIGNKQISRFYGPGASVSLDKRPTVYILLLDLPPTCVHGLDSFSVPFTAGFIPTPSLSSVLTAIAR